MIKAQVCIIGAGAGGIGCAYRLIKKGIKTVIVDKNPDFGGEMVFAGVDGWEPGVSLNGLHQEIAAALESIPLACHTTEDAPNLSVTDPSAESDWSKDAFPEYPWAYAVSRGSSYEKTLAEQNRCRLQFDGWVLPGVIRQLFAPYGDNLTMLFGYSYVSCTKEKDAVTSVTVSNGQQQEVICADYFVDASGEIVLARDAGCPYAFGTEGPEEYGEPSAREKSDNVNGVTYVFRVAQTADADHIDPVPLDFQDVDLTQWEEKYLRKCVACLTKYPNGDINVNMLPTMQGKEYLDLGESADRIGHARVWAYWNYLQTQKGLRGYTLTHIYDAGIRETYRLKGKYVLREQDLRAGMLVQPKPGRTIAIADHAIDIHGEGGLGRHLNAPYEVPLECAMTNEFSNLFVACRGASFTHIAASSVRLSRTMMSMGEGVGEYISELIAAK